MQHVSTNVDLCFCAQIQAAVQYSNLGQMPYRATFCSRCQYRPTLHMFDGHP